MGNSLAQLLSKIWLKRGILLRIFISWSVGALVFLLTQTGNYDTRFKLRNTQPIDKNIIIVHFTEADWEGLLKTFNVDPSNLPGLANTDIGLWSNKIWKSAFEKLLASHPKAIAFTPIITKNPNLVFSDEEIKLFSNPKIIWASSLNTEKHINPQFLPAPYKQQQVIINHDTADDGVLRLIKKQNFSIPQMSEKLAHILNPKRKLKSDSRFEINYAGPHNTYPHISLKKILFGIAPESEIKDKIVIIGTHNARRHEMTTPLGTMDQAEIIANTVDTLSNKKMIHTMDPKLYLSILLLVTLISTYICRVYPHEVSTLMIIGISIGCSASSLWLFDTYYLWTPILAPLTSIYSAFVLFLSLQLTTKEKETWKLEQEKNYLSEVKQFKNNFISLISHDLKTPIAKIQAIIDRVKAENSELKIDNDLKLLREESSELHRYIQSILNILKVEAKDFKLNKDSCDVNRIILEVVQNLTPLYEAKKLKITTDLEPLYLYELDRVLIKEVILNLVENAIKYSSINGSIKVMSTEVENQLLVFVEDSGEGISKEEQEKIFDKFHRGKEQSFHTKGSGLGLYLVKYFIELHGGEVFLESELGKGTTVGFSLPVL